MTKEELKTATGQELIDERNYCGVDGYYGEYLDSVNAEMLKRFNCLAELEKENQLLKAEVKLWKAASENNSYKAFQLQKENAELKKQLGMSNKVYNDNLDYSHHIEEQLTKAKKLLERLLITSCNSDVLNLLPNCSEVLKVRVEAEQFLNSEVEK